MHADTRPMLHGLLLSVSEDDVEGQADHCKDDPQSSQYVVDDNQSQVVGDSDVKGSTVRGNPLWSGNTLYHNYSQLYSWGF